jgi:peroxiredoxin
MLLFPTARILRSFTLSLLALGGAGVALAASGDPDKDWGPILDPNTDKPGLSVGDTAPDATVLDKDGNEVSLAALYKKAPMTVVMFYRGGWCPFCQTSMDEWGSEAGRFAEKDIQVVAISPETYEHAKDTSDAQHIGFKVLADGTTEAMRKYKVAFTLEDQYIDLLRDRLKIEINEWNGSGEPILPAPATYLIDSSGKVLWVFADWDYTKRATPDEVLSAADHEG